ncbi:transmembrane protein, putative [Medicago truncatula]|uniref:Transmembrane protein, putative n=1 Tax=Medicago truncatula TaxID=3880 RepID=G7L507_MEDTR|nr:transmembrane protein, putative [Medicago truncatula]
MLVCHHSSFIQISLFENLKISRGFFELVLPQDLGFRVYGLCFFSLFVLTQAVVKCIIKQQECKGEEQHFLGHLGVVLYEYLGEEGTILDHLGVVLYEYLGEKYLKVLGIKMTPSIKE